MLVCILQANKEWNSPHYIDPLVSSYIHQRCYSDHIPYCIHPLTLYLQSHLFRICHLGSSFYSQHRTHSLFMCMYNFLSLLMTQTLRHYSIPYLISFLSNISYFPLYNLLYVSLKVTILYNLNHQTRSHFLNHIIAHGETQNLILLKPYRTLLGITISLRIFRICFQGMAGSIIYPLA